MKHRSVCVALGVLALAAGASPVMTAAPVRHADGIVEILVNGVPQRRYAHDGRLYVEALDGREYAIRLRNPYGIRVAVALSVDGLNTIDARRTTASDARKWVLDPYETVTISGWQTSRLEARRFEFTTEARSYGHALGQTDNLGIISATFFRERGARSVGDAADRSRGSAPASPAPAREPSAADARASSTNEYAATGMGRRTDHAVTQVWLDLEDTPAQTVNIRYEFRAQLVRLGVLRAPDGDHLQRREHARGFEPGYCPEPRNR
jgi:hypothetical protein